MTLCETLQKATSEENVKGAYIAMSFELRPQVYSFGFLK